MRTVELGAVTQRVQTWNPNRRADELFTYVDLSAVDNETKRIHSSTEIVGSDAPSRARQLIARGDVLVSTVRPNLNAVAVVPSDLDGATASTGFTVLRPDSNVNGRYLFHWVCSMDFVSDMIRKATGASYPAVSDRVVRESHIPLPSIAVQRRIAAILDHADALRAKRRQVLAHLDTLAQSTFHDMFDPADAVGTPLSEAADVTSGITKGRRTSEPVSPVPYLAVANVQAGYLKLDAVKEIAATVTEIERYALREGDLVLTEGGDPDKLGRGTVWRNELPLCIHQNHIFRVRVRRDVELLPDYLAAHIASQTARRYFLRSAKQTTGIASINSTQLKALPIAAPPLARQRVYVDRIALIDRNRAAVQRAITAADELFASLQSRAFRREL